MRLIKHYYYPYFYIEKFNGSFNTIFFLDNSFYFENEDDIFKIKFNFKNVFKKEKKVMVEVNNKIISSLNNYENNDFFNEFFNKKIK